MGLFMRWRGDENHPNPDLPATWVPHKSESGLNGYVDAGDKLRSAIAALHTEAIARLKKDKTGTESAQRVAARVAQRTGTQDQRLAPVLSARDTKKIFS